MIRAFGARKVREAEAPLLAAGVPLMERASGALALAILRLLGGSYGRRALALAGPGNNGGDALFAAASLARRGMGVAAVVAEGAHEAGLAAARAAGCAVLDVADFDAVVREAARADVWIDGILGIGARGGLRGPFASLVERLEGWREGAAWLSEADRPAGASSAPRTKRLAKGGREAGPLVVAVDVPSGIGTDDGAAPGPILRADLTVTMGAPKPGLFLDPARRHAGRVETADIGLGLSAAAFGLGASSASGAAGCAAHDVAGVDCGLPSPDLVSIERADLPLLWPVPGPSSHKYTRGVVGVIAGSASYPGAGFLCVDAALAAGPGMVRYAGTLGSAVISSCPEAVLGEGRVDAWVIGPGLDGEALAHAEPIVDRLRSEGWTAPVVLDAGALAWAERGMTPASVLTPHAGELAALFSRLGIEGSREGIAACPAAAAKLASEATGATVALKGPVDVVASPGSPVYAQSGPAWRAVAGAGDVYAGLLGALLAAGLEPAQAAAAAACVHGLASENGPMRASDIVRNVPAAVRAALAGGSEEESGFRTPGGSVRAFGASDASASAFRARKARTRGRRRPVQTTEECAHAAREEL